MSDVFSKAKWIWISERAGVDEYGEFFGSFEAVGAPTVCRVSCDGDYTLWINGRYAASNQYGDYEHYKIFDEIDITEYLCGGVNRVLLLVWHYGEDSQRYKKAQAGVIFEVAQGAEMLLVSDEHILCRQSPTYWSGYAKRITGQLGFSFLYDATKEGEGGLAPAACVDKACVFYPRPTPRLQLCPPMEGRVLEATGTHYLIDLGAETVGLATLDFVSDTEQKVVVAWGEDLQNGHVRRMIGGRDFSFEYIAKQGENSYTNYMLRLGCRYLELDCEHPIRLGHLGLIPQIYPVKETEVRAMDPLDKRIYDVCVRTLKLCMMEHYVDTPWREQCLYAFDSRNQMLCGYRAFENGNAAYARANLLLMSKDVREDGLLSICYPCGMDLTIPSFSLYYFMAVREYLDATGDTSLAEDVYDKLISVIETFLRHRKDGLFLRFSGRNHWNFYDWSAHLEGHLGEDDEEIPDLMINALFVIALGHLQRISAAVGRPFPYEDVKDTVRREAARVFYDGKVGAFSLTQNGNEFTALGNAMAILAGFSEDADTLCERIAQGEFSECSLSMKCFPYDAMLQTNDAQWRPHIVDEIRQNYGRMLDTGATSVWETMEGAPAFGYAGSLCHGWSAIPICYL